MQKKFTDDICKPELNYMVDITQKLDMIEEMVREGKYFTINRAPKYGKTTTLALLKRRLQNAYSVWDVSFKDFNPSSFENEDVFVRDLLNHFLRVENMDEISKKFMIEMLQESSSLRITKLGSLFKRIIQEHMCEIVIIIDDIDPACDHKVFIDFLGILRNMFLERADGRAAFKSVILAGVYDVSNMRSFLKSDYRYHSPWNIASDFNIDMSFSADSISKMLYEYKFDHALDFDVYWFGHQIYDVTAGYPYVVSRICQILDEEVCSEDAYGSRNAAWSPAGFQRAIQLLFDKPCVLFKDMEKNMAMYPALAKKAKNILLGEEYAFTLGNDVIYLGFMLGYFNHINGIVTIGNKIFETYLRKIFNLPEMQVIQAKESCLLK